MERSLSSREAQRVLKKTGARRRARQEPDVARSARSTLFHDEQAVEDFLDEAAQAYAGKDAKDLFPRQLDRILKRWKTDGQHEATRSMDNLSIVAAATADLEGDKKREYDDDRPVVRWGRAPQY